MTRAALIWTEADQLKLAELPEHGETIISRSPDAQIVLEDRAVSRSPHAAVRSSGGGFVFEHLRAGATPSRVNDLVVEASTQLSDADIIGVGDTKLLFMDLSAGDKRSPFIPCSNPACRRRNNIDRTDCWFCGENLANAESTAYDITRVACRAIAPGWARFDLTNEQRLEFGGAPDARVVDASETGGGVAVEVEQEKVSMRVGTGDAGVSLNGKRPSDGELLRTNDRLTVNGSQYLLIVR